MVAEGPVTPDPHPATAAHDIIRSMSVVRSITHFDGDSGGRGRTLHHYWRTRACAEHNAQQDQQIWFHLRIVFEEKILLIKRSAEHRPVGV